MKQTIYTLILGSLLFLLSCDTSLSNRERYQFSNAHDYPIEAPDDLPPTRGTGNFDIPDDGNRWIWQKPDIVIERLGDLAGKTVADIGAGPYGYFSLRIVVETPAEKVLALDIDEEAIKFLKRATLLLPEDLRGRLESRLVTPNDPQLNEQEADVILVVNTYAYIQNRVNYFARLRQGLAPGGKLVIIDFKRRITPVGPPMEERIALGEVEQELMQAGYRITSSDDRALDYQYILEATIGEEL